jgi:hypothetical protein
MFDLSGGEWPAPQDLAPVFTRTFLDIASPGNGWSGIERVTIAKVGRTGANPTTSDVLPQAAVDAAVLIVKAQSTANEAWVLDTVLEIGATRYVEIVGIASAIRAIDTITEMLGFEAEPLPEPQPGEPVPGASNPRLKRRSAWVPMSGPPKPRFAISASPGTQATVTRLLDRLYPSIDEFGEEGSMRGLTREQAEIVALKVSHSNECFW